MSVLQIIIYFLTEIASLSSIGKQEQVAMKVALPYSIVTYYIVVDISKHYNFKYVKKKKAKSHRVGRDRRDKL